MKFCKINEITDGWVYATEYGRPVSESFKTYCEAYRAAVEAGYFVIDEDEKENIVTI